MSKIELYPIINEGEIIAENGQLDMRTRRGKVCAIQFINQSTNSAVRLKYNGNEILLAPGTGKQGAVHSITMPTFGYDTTVYDISFKDGSGVTPVRNLVVNIQKYVDQD